MFACALIHFADSVSNEFVMMGSVQVKLGSLIALGLGEPREEMVTNPITIIEQTLIDDFES